MSAWEPLVIEDTTPTPSTLTSPSPTPEPEPPLAKKAKATHQPSAHPIEVDVQLNKFDTADKTCATPGCDWVIERPYKSDLCVVCEQKKCSEAEKEKLRSALSARAKGEAVSSCFGYTPVVHHTCR